MAGGIGSAQLHRGLACVHAGRLCRTAGNTCGTVYPLRSTPRPRFRRRVSPSLALRPASVPTRSACSQTYSLDCYFRQTWVDRRLAFRGEKQVLSLSISMLGKIWKPDTYFYNGRESHLHTITVPNKFVRLYQDGRVLYSSR